MYLTIASEFVSITSPKKSYCTDDETAAKQRDYYFYKTLCLCGTPLKYYHSVMSRKVTIA